MQYIRPNLKGVMLNVTDDCNLRCKYCFVNKSPNYMPFKIAKDTLDLLVSINNNPSITFFGGEPTLCWDSIIVPLVDYSKTLDKQVDFHITTNGILLDENKLKYMKDNNIDLLLSMDGIKECQDINRPFINGEGSFDMLYKKLPLILNYFPDTTFRATLYPSTCHTLFDSILFAENEGFKCIFMVPDEGSTWEPEHKKILDEQLALYADYYIQKTNSGESVIELSSISNLYSVINAGQIALNNNEDCSICSFPSCGLGIDYASVNYEGKIFACQELPSNNDINKKYYIGDIYNGIDKTRHDKLIDTYKKLKLTCVNSDLCTDCSIKVLCTKLICHANAYIYNGNMGKKSEIKCFWDQLLFKNASKIIKALDKNDSFIKLYLQRILNER